MRPFSSLLRPLGILLSLSLGLSTCSSSSNPAHEWILYIDLAVEETKPSKPSRRLSFPRLPRVGRGLLQALLGGRILLSRLPGLLLGGHPTAPCPHPRTPHPCPCLHTFLQQDPLVRRYQRLFALFDFSFLPSLPSSCIPLQAFLKAYLVMVDQKIQTFSHLRHFLRDHPALTLSLGFRPHPPSCPVSSAPWHPYVPSERYLRKKIQRMDPAFCKTLFAQTVQKIHHRNLLSGTVACDVKELWAHVRQNNPKQFVKERWNKDQIPAGNPDARLGAKPSSNKDPQGKPLPRLFWGFKSAIFAAPTPHGLVILAESTHPANTGDVSCFAPLLSEFLAYGLKALTFLADAAFDAWVVYQAIAHQGGKAYIPLNARGHDTLAHAYSPTGKLLCPAGLDMKSGGTWLDPHKGYRRKKWLCPHKGHAQPCPHAHGKPTGCTRVVNLDDLYRFELDRSSPHFQKVYKTRTLAERAFSLFQDYGRSITYQRNLRSVTHLNTLTYTLLNARVLLKAASVPVPT